MNDMPALEQLIGAYLNQDLWDFYPDVMVAVDDFTRDAPGLAVGLPAEIEAALADQPTEPELAELLRGLGVGFLPDEHGYRTWLTQIADRVRAATARA